MNIGKLYVRWWVKIEAGLFKPKLLQRKRIDKILEQIFERGLFIATASIGYGKTTAIRNFLEKHENIQSIWFYPSMNKYDDGWLWKRICHIVECTNKGLGMELSSCGFPKNNDDMYKIIDLLNANVEKETVIILDDWQEIENKKIIRIVETIIFEHIPKLHIVIISRNMLPDKYLEYEVKNKCTIMWQDDLSFTLEETNEFFKINGFKLNDKEKADIYNYTSGWLAATYLSIIEYSKNRKLNNIPIAAKLIKSTVYEKLNEDEKNILLQLSLLENFTLEQAIYINQNRNTYKVIKELSDNNCFVKYDADLEIYIMHSIFRIVLKEEAENLNINFDSIYNKCADWYVLQKDIISGLKYYSKAKNYDKIFELIENIWGAEYIDLESNLFISIFNEMSKEQKIKYSIAYLTFIYCYLVSINRTYARELLEDAKKLYIDQADIKNRNQLLGEISIIESFLYSNLDIRLNYLKKAYDYFNGGISHIINAEVPFSLGSKNVLQLYHKEKGKLKEIVKTFEKNIWCFVHISNGGGAGSEYLIRAEFEYETGNIEKSELFAYKALYKAKSKNQTSILIATYFLIMRIELNKGNTIKVNNRKRNLEEEAKKFKLPILITSSELAITYIQGLMGMGNDIPYWIRECDILKSKSILEAYGACYVEFGISMILRKSYIELEVLVETMIDEYENNNNIFGQIYAYIFDSIAKYYLYGIEKSKISYFKGISIAKEDSIIMPFVEFSTYTTFMIKEISSQDEYLQKLLCMINKYMNTYKKINQNSKINTIYCDLTEREIEVMDLICSGYKQVDIGNTLNISLNTVRYHSKNIYDKLGVSNKALAIQKYNTAYNKEKVN